MALRFLLVSLVAGMGLELPSGQDLSSWTRAGREWASARMSEVSSLRADAERALLGSTDCERADESPGPMLASEIGTSTADLAFDVVVEGMVQAFAADLASSRLDRPEPDFLPEVIVDQPGGQVPPILAWIDPEPGSLAASVSEAPAPTAGVSARVDRLTVAVRLTRQAVIAWASLIEGSTEILTDSR